MDHAGQRFQQGGLFRVQRLRTLEQSLPGDVGGDTEVLPKGPQDLVPHHVRAEMTALPVTQVALQTGGAVNAHDRLADLERRRIGANARHRPCIAMPEWAGHWNLWMAAQKRL